MVSKCFEGLAHSLRGPYFRIDVAAATNLWNTGFENAESYTVGALDGQEGVGLLPAE